MKKGVGQVLKLNGKTAVFIDAANLELSAKDLGFRIDYKKLKRFLEEQGNIVYIGFYTVRFNNKAHDDFLTVLKKAGFKLVTKPIKIIKNRDKKLGDIRKANFDVEITVDAINKSNEYETIVLFSGDSDFTYLIKELRKRRKKVIVISLRYHIAKELVEMADYYFDLRKIKEKIKRQ